MTHEEITNKVKEIVVDQLGVCYDQVTEDASFIDDLNGDSLDSVELVLAIKEEYGINIPENEATKLKKVGDVINYLCKVLEVKGESIKTKAAQLLGTTVYVISPYRMSLFGPAIDIIKLDSLSYNRKDKCYNFITPVGFIKINDDGELVSNNLFITSNADKAVEHLTSMANSVENKEN